MYQTDENKIDGNLRMQNVTGNETLAASMFEGNPTSMYPHVHIVNNPIPISSKTSESQAIDPNVFHSSGNAPLTSIISTQGNAPSTSRTFLKNSVEGNVPNTSNNGNVPNSNGNAPLIYLYFYKKETRKIRKKRRNTKTKMKNNYLLALSNPFSRQILCKLSSSIFVYSLL